MAAAAERVIEVYASVMEAWRAKYGDAEDGYLFPYDPIVWDKLLAGHGAGPYYSVRLTRPSPSPNPNPNPNPNPRPNPNPNPNPNPSPSPSPNPSPNQGAWRGGRPRRSAIECARGGTLDCSRGRAAEGRHPLAHAPYADGASELVTPNPNPNPNPNPYLNPNPYPNPNQVGARARRGRRALRAGRRG